MSDLVERLRAGFDNFAPVLEAANEIDRLTAALAVAEKQGWEKAKQQAAEVARGQTIETNQQTGEPRLCGTEAGNWSVPQPKAGYRGSDYGTGRYDAAAAILAMEPK